MTDEIIAPLMPNSSTEQDEDEKYELSISEDIHDNENENLLNNIRRENINNNNRIIIPEFNAHEKRGLIYLSYAFQTLLFFLSLYYLFDYMNNNNYIKQNLNIIILISVSIIGLILLILLNNHLILIRAPYIFLIPLALISTLSMFFILYKISILLSFKIMAWLMITCFAFYLNLFIIYFFYNAQNNLEQTELIISIIIIFCFGFAIKIFENIEILVITDMLMSVFILKVISIVHVNKLPDNLYGNCPLMHIGFHIDIALMLLLDVFCHLIETKN